MGEEYVQVEREGEEGRETGRGEGRYAVTWLV